MTNQIQAAARAKKIGRGPSAKKKEAFPAQQRAGAVGIDFGVRVRCQELSADLAVIRFDCGARSSPPAPPWRPSPPGSRRAARPSGAS